MHSGCAANAKVDRSARPLKPRVRMRGARSCALALLAAGGALAGEPSFPASAAQPAGGPEAGSAAVLAGRRAAASQRPPDSDIEGLSSRSPAASFWVPRSNLTGAQRAGLPGHCSGRYLLPPLPFPEDVDDDTMPIEGEADLVDYETDGDITLQGDVLLTQGNRTITAGRAVLGQASRQGLLQQGVYIREPDLVMRGTHAEVDLDRETATVHDAEFLLPVPEFRGEAESVARDEAGNVVLSRQTFTRCEPGNNNWRVSARSVRLPEKAVFGTARHAVIRLKGVPVMYTPYIKFPVTDDRQSGFLFPNLEFSGEDGLDLSTPYYLNLAPNQDATISPRIISKRGIGLQGEYRRLSRWERSSVSGAILPGDDLYNGTMERDDWEDRLAAGLEAPETFEAADRWQVNVDHRGRLGRFATAVNYSEASDRDYFRDLGSDLGESSRIALQQWGQLSYRSGGLFMRLWGQAFQRLDEIERNEYKRLPELEILYTGRGLGPLEYSVWATGSSFDRNTDGLRGINALTGERMHVEPRLVLPLRRPYGFLKASAAYRYTEYRLKSAAGPLDERSPNRGAATGSLDGGLIFERNLDWFDAPLVQTLEPRLYYLYQEYEHQDDLPLFDAKDLTAGYLQLFRENRFSGLDRIGDANQLALGVTTRFFGRESGREYLRASVGQIRHFRNRRVTLRGRETQSERHSTSAIAGELAGRLANRWKVLGSLVWDPNDNQIDEAAGMIQYQVDGRRVINVGYRNRLLQDIDQTDLSFYWPVSDRYAVFGRWNHDLVSGRIIEGMAGIEYNDCCWRIRLLARRFLDQPAARSFENVDADEGVFLQIELKGLAGIGGRMDSVLQRGIRGYRGP